MEALENNELVGQAADSQPPPHWHPDLPAAGRDSGVHHPAEGRGGPQAAPRWPRRRQLPDFGPVTEELFMNMPWLTGPVTIGLVATDLCCASRPTWNYDPVLFQAFCLRSRSRSRQEHDVLGRRGGGGFDRFRAHALRTSLKAHDEEDTIAISRKLMTVLRNAPSWMTGRPPPASHAGVQLAVTKYEARLLKSTPPMIRPMTGMTTDPRARWLSFESAADDYGDGQVERSLCL